MGYSLNAFIPQHFADWPRCPATLGCKANAARCKRRNRRGITPVIVPFGLHLVESRKKSGGLGSSHTAPCGAAVPARPPTRSSDITHLHWGPQWVARATRRGTRVVVQRRYANSFPGTSMGNNSCIINTLIKTERPLRALSVQIVLSCAADYEVFLSGSIPSTEESAEVSCQCHDDYGHGLDRRSVRPWLPWNLAPAAGSGCTNSIRHPISRRRAPSPLKPCTSGNRGGRFRRGCDCAEVHPSTSL
jgi:hypothetical protein